MSLSFVFQLVATRKFQSPLQVYHHEVGYSRKSFRFWNNKDNTFQFKLPPGTCKAEISFMGVTGIHEFYFSKNTSEASHVSWEDYDYEYKSEAYMLDREFTKRGRHPQLLRDPFQGLRTCQSSTILATHLISEMDP